MINPLDSIRYQNVISRKYRFHFSEMEGAMQDFLQDISILDVTLRGPMFYSLNNVPMDEIMNVEFFMPVENNYVEVMEDMQFHSYFSVEDMVSICLFENFEQDTEVGYAMILKYLEENGFEQATPMFHIFSGDETLQYVFLKMGYIVIDNQKVWK